MFDFFFLTVSDALAQAQTILLVAEGVDTVATIFINGQLVNTTNNMFVKYTFDVTRFIQVGAASTRVILKNGLQLGVTLFASKIHVLIVVCDILHYV